MTNILDPTWLGEFRYKEPVIKGAAILLFPHVDDFVRVGNDPKLQRYGKASRETGDPEWRGSRTYDEAIQYFQEGIEFDKLERKFEEQKLLIQAREQTTFYDVTGACVDVGQYVSGVPECMLDFTQDMLSSKLIRLVVQIGDNAGVSGEQLIRRGVAIALLVDSLENSGYRVAVDGVSGTTGVDRDGNGLVYFFSVKLHNEASNLQRLFAIFHPSFFRRLCFALEELVPGLSFGYGSAMQWSKVAEYAAQLYGEEDYLVLPNVRDSSVGFYQDSDIATFISETTTQVSSLNSPRS